MANKPKVSVSGSISDKDKKSIAKYLKNLRNQLKKSLNELDLYGQGAFDASPVVVDFSKTEIKQQVRINIRRRRNKEGKLVLKGSKPKEEMLENLSEKFHEWFNEALIAGIRKSKVKKVTKKYLLEKAELHAFRTAKKKLPRKYIVQDSEGAMYFRGTNTIWFYNASVINQKDAFRRTILKHSRLYSERKKNALMSAAKNNSSLKAQQLAEEYKVFNTWLHSVHLGHTFGLKASQLGNVFDYSDTGSLAKSVKKGTIQLKNIQAIKNIDFIKGLTQNFINKLDIDMNFEVEKQITPGKDGLIQGLILEFGPDNTASGAELKKQLDEFANFKVEEALEALKSNITANQLLNILSSRTSEEIIADNIIDTFIGKKPKTYKSKKQYKDRATKTKRSKIPTQKLSLASKIIAEIEIISEEDLNEKIPYLNRRLHDKIQQNMGKGGAKEVLNYRTGRFARSAEIESFFPSREKGAVNAVVRYMRYPYGTFEPGGRLHKPGRDPHRIFGRSIRQLLQEEKLATLRRVKVELRG